MIVLINDNDDDDYVAFLLKEIYPKNLYVHLDPFLFWWPRNLVDLALENTKFLAHKSQLFLVF